MTWWKSRQSDPDGKLALIEAVMLAKNVTVECVDDPLLDPERAPGVVRSATGDRYAHPWFVRQVAIEEEIDADTAHRLAERLAARMLG